jgi:hypothetical protein
MSNRSPQQVLAVAFSCTEVRRHRGGAQNTSVRASDMIAGTGNDERTFIVRRSMKGDERAQQTKLLSVVAICP